MHVFGDFSLCFTIYLSKYLKDTSSYLYYVFGYIQRCRVALGIREGDYNFIMRINTILIGPCN